MKAMRAARADLRKAFEDTLTFEQLGLMTGSASRMLNIKSSPAEQAAVRAASERSADNQKKLLESLTPAQRELWDAYQNPIITYE